MLYLNNISKATYLLLLSLPFCGIGCHFLSTEEEIEVVSSSNRLFHFELAKDSASIVYHTDTVFLTESDTLDITNEATARIILSYPVLDANFVDEVLKDSIKQLLNYILLRQKDDDLAYQSLEHRMQDFIDQFKEFDLEMQSFGLMTGPKWSNTVYIDIITDRQSVVTLRVREEEFMGGAHPNNAVSYYNLEKQTGQKLLLTTLFDTVQLKELSKILEVSFMAETSLDTMSQNEETIFGQDPFPLPSQFALLDTAMLFQYEAYNLGAFAYKDISLVLSYDSIYQLLDVQLIQLDTIYRDTITIF